MKFSLATLAVLTLASGCAERAPRSFVQPNVLKKSDLDGTWYYLQTVADAPPTSQSAFIGLSSELMKIRFDIQEDTIYARRSYEQIQGSEDAYQQNPEKYAGQPLAAWHIQNQFDIIRDYNPTTGEETNRIIESTERAWNEREFIRVDWSQNQAVDYVGIGLNFFFDGVQVQGISYWESDPSSPDALHLERADANDEEWVGHVGEATYLDITQKMVVTPDQRTECDDTGCYTFPACFFSYSVSDCSSQVVKVKHAFAKLAPVHDYQPRNWDGTQMNLFGIWDVGLNRLTYNRQYGITNSGFNRHAARFNLWKQSYQADGKTPIPYAQRQLRTIPYYAESSNGTFPPELFAQGQNIIDQWNGAVGNAVKLVTNSTIPAAGQRVFVWCHNPVKLAADTDGAADPDQCKVGLRPDLDSNGNPITDAAGNPILHARQGDPRRSQIFWVNQEQDAGPLGYGPPLFDVETGETISGQAYIYGAAVDTYSARSRDLVQLVTGALDPNDYVAGVNVKAWVQANRAGVSGKPQTFTAADVVKKHNTMDFSWAKGAAPEAPIDKSSGQAFVTSLANRENAMYKQGVFGSSQSDVGQVLRDSLRGTDIEAQMVTSDIMAIGGSSPKADWSSLSETDKYRISPLRSQAVQQLIDQRMDNMRALGFDFDDFADEGITQRALNLASNPTTASMDPEAIRQQLRKDIFLAVTLHEVGHNMGLRHNFRASFDALNYFPQYWTLRSAAASNAAAQKYDGLSTSSSGGLTVQGTAYAGTDCTANPGKIRPRYVDCPGGATSVDEVNGGVREYQYSSIMDYGAEFNSDLQGLGKYDMAAMKFSYAGDGYVEVFTDLNQGNQTQEARFESIQYFQNSFGFPSPLSLQGGALTSVNYESYPDMFNSGITGINMRADVPYSDITAVQGITGVNELVDSQGRGMVPYFFCSDEFVGNLTCQRFDSGADAFEQANDLISRYHNFYLLNDFKRDRYTFHTSSSYRSRIASRYFDMLRDQLTWYALLKADFADFATDAFFTDEDSWGNFTVAVTNGFDLMGRVLTTPDSGSFSQVTPTSSADYPYTYWKQTSDTISASAGTLNVPLLEGKFSATTWDFTGCGYYWADECQTRIGYLLDKMVAIDVLSQSQAYFTGRDTATDVRRYAIGYIRPFRNQIEEKFGALFAGDYASLAPQAVTDPVTQQVTIKYDSWSDNNGSTSTPKSNLVDPTTGFTIQLFAAVYGLSEFPTTFDQSFVDSTRIFVVGNGEAPVPDAALMDDAGNAVGNATTDPTQVIGAGGSKEWLLWTDPDSKKTYGAHSSTLVGDGNTAGTYRGDAATRMIQQAIAIYAQATTACGSLPPPVATANQTQCAMKYTAATNYRDNLDLMRGLQKRFGYARP